MKFYTKLVYVITLLVYAELYNCVILERSRKDVLNPLNGQNCDEIVNTHISGSTCICTTAVAGASILSIEKGELACVADEKIQESKNT